MLPWNIEFLRPDKRSKPVFHFNSETMSNFHKMLNLYGRYGLTCVNYLWFNFWAQFQSCLDFNYTAFSPVLIFNLSWQGNNSFYIKLKKYEGNIFIRSLSCIQKKLSKMFSKLLVTFLGRYSWQIEIRRSTLRKKYTLHYD